MAMSCTVTHSPTPPDVSSPTSPTGATVKPAEVKAVPMAVSKDAHAATSHPEQLALQGRRQLARQVLDQLTL